MQPSYRPIEPKQPVFLPPKDLETHYGVVCDNCKTQDFSGKRFKCTSCLDYDLCEFCYGNRFKFHSAFHLFKQVKVGEQIYPNPNILPPPMNRFPEVVPFSMSTPSIDQNQPIPRNMPKPKK